MTDQMECMMVVTDKSMPRRIYETILASPGRRRADIARCLGVHKSTIRYWLARMDGYRIFEDCEGDFGPRRGMWPEVETVGEYEYCAE